ncbi:DHA2 family efflux MFS transporter permease subunit [Nonomuraea sp. NPDC046802]|uniref:DHA2 family efflux MFS transporter permease subunit n=1 Tax=Nonomuraea sp. NPDC046802 TaxID=3154919 RepID=UPI0033ECAF44
MSAHTPAAHTAPSTAALIVLCMAHFMDAIDLSDVTVALPSIQAEYGLSAGTLGWIVSAYLLGYGGFLLLGGRASDVLGRRRVFLVSVAVFGVASLIATFAPGVEILIASRFVKGVAAGFLTPAALSLITTMWSEPQARGRAIGVFAMAGAAGFIGGLVLGGLVTEISWRLAFALPLPFAAAVMILGPRLIPHDRAVARGILDAVGAALVTAAFGGLIVYLSIGATEGWTNPFLLALLVACALLFTGFVVRQRLASDPLLPLGFLRRRNTAGSAVAIAALWAAYNGFAFLATLSMQDALGWSPLATGLAFVPLGIVNGILAPQMGRLAGRIGAKPLVIVGAVLLAVSYALFLRVGPDAEFVTEFLPIMVVNGLGLACTFAPLNLAAMDGVPPERQGLAAAILNTAMQLGGAIGLAVVTVVTANSTGTSAYPTATVVIVAMALAVLLGSLLLPGRRRRTATDA